MDPDQRIHRLPLSIGRRDRPQHPLGPFDLQPVDHVRLSMTSAGVNRTAGSCGPPTPSRRFVVS